MQKNLLDVCQSYFQNQIRTCLGRSHDASKGHPQDVGRKHSLNLNIRPCGDVLITSAGDVLKTSIRDIPWRYVQDSMGRPQDVTLRRPQCIIFQRPKDVGRGRTLALHKGPYGDYHRTSFGDVVCMSSRRNFLWKIFRFSSFFGFGKQINYLNRNKLCLDRGNCCFVLCGSRLLSNIKYYQVFATKSLYSESASHNKRGCYNKSRKYEARDG